MTLKQKIEPDRRVFDQMAPGWYNFRHYSIFRTELESLNLRWQKGRLLNIGCGHGPDFLPFKGAFALSGLDFSAEMLKLARRYSHKFEFPVNLFMADAYKLPFADGSFDFAIAIASYHHLKGHQRQLEALLELKRVLKPGGEAFITVWNRCQTRFWFKGREMALPWRSKGGIIQRYYYLFTYWEIEALVRQAGFRILKSQGESSYHFPVKYFSRNICLLVKKETKQKLVERCSEEVEYAGSYR